MSSVVYKEVVGVHCNIKINILYLQKILTFNFRDMDNKLKLKQEDQVLYWDGSTTLELTTVVQVYKEKSQVKLSNGVIIHRLPDEDGTFSRADYKEVKEEKEKRRRKSKLSSLRSNSKSWKYGSEETARIWHAYLFKKSFANTYDKLRNKVTLMSCKEIIYNTENLEFLEKVQRKISKI